MGLKIEQECEWCEVRESVDLPRTGPLDLSQIPLPSGWARKPAFPGGNVGSQDGQDLCETCAGNYQSVLEQADRARDHVFNEAMRKAKEREGNIEVDSRSRGSSSFARV